MTTCQLWLVGKWNDHVGHMHAMPRRPKGPRVEEYKLRGEGRGGGWVEGEGSSCCRALTNANTTDMSCATAKRHASSMVAYLATQQKLSGRSERQ